MHQRLLFYNQNIFDVTLRRKQDLRDAISKLPNPSLDDPDSPRILANSYRLSIPRLDETKKYAKTREVEIDISHDPMRSFMYGFGPSYVKGTRIDIFVPFEGDGGLFDVRPATFDTNPPRGEVHGNELCLSYEMLESETQIAPQIEQTLASVRKYLDWLRPSAAQLEGELEQQARELITQQRQRNNARSSALNSLGIPIRNEPQARAAPLVGRVQESTPKGRRAAQFTEKWDVFISHASEDKEKIARPLAIALNSRGVSVWYDEFSLKLGDSLRQAIEAGLSRSRFGVVILSRHFFEKHWPLQELNGLATREVNGHKVILPIWHNLGFDEVRTYSPILADRLAVRTKEGINQVVGKILEVIK